jgi:hypothetical protein
MNKSESIKELACALAKAQGEFAGAAKDSTNPHFKSKYADLESVVAAIKPHLKSHGLSFIQTSNADAGSAAIETTILHSSGEWISCGIVSVPVSKADAQGYGSAMTYARRYSLSAAFGIAPEDDDGNAASKSPGKKLQDEKLPKITEAELATLCADKLDPESGEIIKMGYKSTVQSGKKKASDFIEWLSKKATVSEEIKAIIEGWEPIEQGEAQ